MPISAPSGGARPSIQSTAPAFSGTTLKDIARNYEARYRNRDMGELFREEFLLRADDAQHRSVQAAIVNHSEAYREFLGIRHEDNHAVSNRLRRTPPRIVDNQRPFALAQAAVLLTKDTRIRRCLGKLKDAMQQYALTGHADEQHNRSAGQALVHLSKHVEHMTASFQMEALSIVETHTRSLTDGLRGAVVSALQELRDTAACRDLRDKARQLHAANIQQLPNLNVVPARPSRDNQGRRIAMGVRGEDDRIRPPLDEPASAPMSDQPAPPYSELAPQAQPADALHEGEFSRDGAHPQEQQRNSVGARPEPTLWGSSEVPLRRELREYMEEALRSIGVIARVRTTGDLERGLDIILRNFSRELEEPEENGQTNAGS